MRLDTLVVGMENNPHITDFSVHNTLINMEDPYNKVFHYFTAIDLMRQHIGVYKIT